MLHPVGALVRVKWDDLRAQDRNFDGSLWIVRKQLQHKDAYRCKALATGNLYVWFDDELEEEETEDALP